jgi:fimbrial chaperone protein
MFFTPVKYGRLTAMALLVSGASTSALALNVQPLVLDMVSIGSHTREVIQIINDGASPIPVEVSVKKLDIALDGKTSDLPAGEEFLIFPPQAVVPAGTTQNFRIQWVGEPNIQKSQSYMVHVNQLPVKRNSNESGVQIVFDFGVIVNVAPPGGQSGLKLVSAEPATEGGKRGAAITVENPSAMYSYFTDAAINIESGSWHKSFIAGELRNSIGYGVVLPGKKRRFFVASEVPEGAGKVSATINYTPKVAK